MLKRFVRVVPFWLVACSFTGSPSSVVVDAGESDRLDAAKDSAIDAGGASFVPPGYKQTFADEFDVGTFALDLDNDGAENWAPYWTGWNVRHLEGNSDKALKADVAYMGSGGTPLGVELHDNTDDSTLRLLGYPLAEARRAQFFGFPYVAGMISGQRSHSQLFGYWEVRMRVVTASRGHHWAVWLIPSDNSWPPEVDMLEVVGLDPSTFYFNSHYRGTDGEHLSSGTSSGAPLAPDDWYVVGFLWTAEEMKWFIDGALVHAVPNREHAKPFYFLISPEIGGNWPGLPDEATVWPMEAEIDYVRIYQKETP